MNKIPTLFKRDFENNPKFVLPEYNKGTEWVANGEGVATRKWDGMAIRISYDDDKPLLSKRFDVKEGRKTPKGWESCGEADPKTGHWPGWLKVDPLDKSNKWIMEAYNSWYVNNPGEIPKPGTYEVCGPKIGTRMGSNPENLPFHVMIRHGEEQYLDAPRDFEGLKAWLADKNIEGLVWHHSDGQMVKIKRSDFGLI